MSLEDLKKDFVGKKGRRKDSVTIIIIINKNINKL